MPRKKIKPAVSPEPAPQAAAAPKPAVAAKPAAKAAPKTAAKSAVKATVKAAPRARVTKKPAACVVCGADVAPFSTEELCWVCRRLKISAWRDSETQSAAQD